MSNAVTEKLIALWRLLDDIDTLDDACKGDNAAFRSRCYEIQRRRFDIVSGDEFDALSAALSVHAEPTKPVICIGHHTISQLMAGEAVEIDAAIMIPASDLTEPANVDGSPLLEWAISKWNAEVKNRELVNVHRRSLDDAWRQVIRWAGGDPVALVGPSHDELRAKEGVRS